MKKPKKKVSQTLFEYAQPLIQELPQNPTKDDMEKVLMVAATVWDSTVHKQCGKGQYLNQLRLNTGNGPMGDLLESLIERKRKLYRTEQYLVADFEIVPMESNSFRVMVRARKPDNTLSS